jgi:Arginase/agmatinase/formimionoglutamate hydrolase, arginase family
VLKEETPNKVITFGGSCLVSQAPFDYLHGEYKDKLGVIWLDSHPDVSTPKEFYHEHAMVLGNLLGAGDPELSKNVAFPFESSQFLYVGIQKPLGAEIKLLKDLNLNYTVQDKYILNVEEIQEWIKQNDFTKIAIQEVNNTLRMVIFTQIYLWELIR